MFILKETEAISTIQQLQDEILAVKDKVSMLIPWLLENRSLSPKCKSEEIIEDIKEFIHCECERCKNVSYHSDTLHVMRRIQEIITQG